MTKRNYIKEFYSSVKPGYEKTLYPQVYEKMIAYLNELNMFLTKRKEEEKKSKSQPKYIGDACSEQISLYEPSLQGPPRTDSDNFIYIRPFLANAKSTHTEAMDPNECDAYVRDIYQKSQKITCATGGSYDLKRNKRIHYDTATGITYYGEDLQLLYSSPPVKTINISSRYNPNETLYIFGYNNRIKQHNKNNNTKYYELVQGDINRCVITQTKQLCILPLMANLKYGEIYFTTCVVKPSKYGVAIEHKPICDKSMYVVNMITNTIKKYDTNKNCACEVRKLSQFPVDLMGLVQYNSFLEELFSLKSGSLNQFKSLHDVIQLGVSTQNLLQAFLQTRGECAWLLDGIMNALRPIADTSKCSVLGTKNVQECYGMSLPELRYFMKQPDSSEFTTFMLMQKHKKTSLAEFKRVYPTILELNKHWAVEEEVVREESNAYGWREQDKVIITNSRGRHVFASRCVPIIEKEYSKYGYYRHISLYQYIKYMVAESKRMANKYPEHENSLRRLVSDLNDYNRMLKEVIPNKKTVFPYNLKASHDSMVKNYNATIKEKKIDNYTCYMFKDAYRYAAENAYEDNTYIMVTPRDPYDLQYEGISLNHCVGSYATDIAQERGKNLIFFLREKARMEHSLITVQVRRTENNNSYRITQISGAGCRPPKREEKQFADMWLMCFNDKTNDNIKYHRNEVSRQNIATVTGATYNQNLLQRLQLGGAIIIDVYDTSKSEEENYNRLLTNSLPMYVSQQIAEGLWSEDTKEQFITDVKKLLGRVLYKALEQSIHNTIDSAESKWLVVANNAAVI